MRAQYPQVTVRDRGQEYSTQRVGVTAFLPLEPGLVYMSYQSIYYM